MNLILLDLIDPEPYVILSAGDPRVLHIETILNQTVGDRLFVGIPQGLHGKAKIIEHTVNGMLLEVEWSGMPNASLAPLHLIMGLPRPQTARKILENTSALGIQSIAFVMSDKSDPNYRKSHLWHTDEWIMLLRKGAQQACQTTYPVVNHVDGLALGIESASFFDNKIALDVYESTHRFSSAYVGKKPLTLAIGPERGWSDNERNLLRKHGFQLMHLGERVLRCETACIAAISIYLSQY
jgi:RsmE family RNA methyltransferase